MNIRERLGEFQKKNGISNYALEHNLGLSNGYMNKCRNPSADVLESLLRLYPELSAEWLMRGEGSMDRLEAAVMEAKGDEPLTPVSEEQIKALINESVEQKLKEAIERLKA